MRVATRCVVWWLNVRFIGVKTVEVEHLTPQPAGGLTQHVAVLKQIRKKVIEAD